MYTEKIKNYANKDQLMHLEFIFMFRKMAEGNFKIVHMKQETFDSIVKENIEDLDMSPEEAVADAVESSIARVHS